MVYRKLGDSIIGDGNPLIFEGFRDRHWTKKSGLMA